MSDLQVFMDAGAELMYTDRPDIWKTKEDAKETLVRWFADLNGEHYTIGGKPVDSIGTGGFELIKYQEKGEDWEPGDYIEYSLVRKLVDISFEPNNIDTGCFDWTSHGSVFHVGDLGID